MAYFDGFPVTMSSLRSGNQWRQIRKAHETDNIRLHRRISQIAEETGPGSGGGEDTSDDQGDILFGFVQVTALGGLLPGESGPCVTNAGPKTLVVPSSPWSGFCREGALIFTFDLGSDTFRAHSGFENTVMAKQRGGGIGGSWEILGPPMSVAKLITPDDIRLVPGLADDPDTIGILTWHGKWYQAGLDCNEQPAVVTGCGLP